MTVAVATPAAIFQADAVTTRFPTIDGSGRPWPFLSPSDLIVGLLDAAGAETIVAGGYTVEGAGAGSGAVTFASAPAGGLRVRIRRRTPIAQPTVYVPNDDFPAKSHERALDRVTMISQETRGGLDALDAVSVRVPIGEGGFTLPAMPGRAARLPTFDALGGFGLLAPIGQTAIVTIAPNGTPVAMAPSAFLPSVAAGDFDGGWDGLPDGMDFDGGFDGLY